MVSERVFFTVCHSKSGIILARLYVSTGRAIAVTTASASLSASALASASASALLKMLKFLVKVFKSLYLLKPWKLILCLMLNTGLKF